MLRAVLLTTCLVAAGSLRAQQSDASAFAIAFGGALAGSAAGVGLGLALAGPCDAEDLSCELRGVGTVLLLSVPASAGGSLLASQWANSRRSALGAGIGAVAGAAAGVGMIHLLTEEVHVVSGRLASLLVYSATQATVTAIGSQLVAAWRR